jgi:transposase
MVQPDTAKWNQTLSDLRRLSTEAPHARTRERYMALYMIASEQTSATRWASEIGRTKETVLGWVHRYNQAGPTGLTYRRTGGRTPLLRQNRSSNSSKP